MGSLSFDAGSIESTLDVDVRPFNAGLQRAKDDARRFANEKYAATVDVDDRRGQAKVIDFKTRLESVARTKATASVAVENEQAIRKLVDTSDRLDRLRKDVATARVNADTDDAKRRLDALDLQLRRIGLITSRPKVTLEGVERANLQLDGLGLRLAALSRSGGGSGGGGGRVVSGGAGGGGFSRFTRSLPSPSWLALGIGAAAPLAGGAAGLAAGGAASFLTPTAASLIGLGGFAAAAKSSIGTVNTDVEKLTKLTAKYDAAVTNKQRAAVLKQEAALWASMDPQQRAAVKNVTALETAWSRFKKKLEPQSFAALAGGARVANTGLGLLLPSSRAAGNAVVRAEGDLNRGLKSPFSKQFFGQFLPGETTAGIRAMEITLGHFLSGTGHLIEQFAPLGHDLEGILERVSGRFDKWSQGSGPQRFVTWVEREGPVAAQALVGLAHGLEGVGVGLGPIARVELQALTPTLEFLGRLGKEHPEVITAVGTALLTVGAGLKVIKGVGTVSNILSKIPGLGGGGGAGGGGIVGRVLGGAAAPGSSPAHPAWVVVVNNEGGGSGIPPVGGGGGGGTKPGEGGGTSRTGKLKGVGGGFFSLFASALGLTNIISNQAKLPSNASVTDRALNAVGSGMVFGTQGGELNPGYHGHATLSGMSKNDWLSLVHGNQPQDKPIPTIDLKTGKKGTESVAEQKAGYDTLIAKLKEHAKTEKGAAAALAAYTAEVKAQQRSLGDLNGLLVTNTGMSALNAKSHQQDVSATVKALSAIPGALAALRRQMTATGKSSGQALADGITFGIKQGEGKVLLVTRQLVGDVLHTISNKAQIASPSKITTRYGQDIAEGLSVGFGRQLPSVRAAFAHGTKSAIAAITSRLDSARQQLSTDRSTRSQFQSSLTSSYTGGLNLSSAVGPAGNVGNVGSFIGNYAGLLKTLSIDLGKLAKMGLSPALLDQIAQMNPQQGVAVAQAILSGHSGSVSHLNHEWAAVGTYAGRAAGTDAQAMYGSTVSMDQKVVDLLTQLLAATKSNPKAVAAAIDHAIAVGKVHR